jgi:hypothetical protein
MVAAEFWFPRAGWVDRNARKCEPLKMRDLTVSVSKTRMCMCIGMQREEEGFGIGGIQQVRLHRTL